MSEQEKTFEADGTRPIESGEIEVADTYQEDGKRPIAESPDFLVRDDRTKQADSQQSNERSNKTAQSPADSDNAVASGGKEVVDTFEVDGTRPIVEGEMKVADTYQEDGTRPIGKGADFLVESARENQAESSANKPSSNKETKADATNSTGSGGREVVDTFEADGTRPVMSNKYDVVDTLDIDGERPITSEQG